MSSLTRAATSQGDMVAVGRRRSQRTTEPKTRRCPSTRRKRGNQRKSTHQSHHPFHPRKILNSIFSITPQICLASEVASHWERATAIITSRHILGALLATTIAFVRCNTPGLRSRLVQISGLAFTRPAGVRGLAMAATPPAVSCSWLKDNLEKVAPPT